MRLAYIITVIVVGTAFGICFTSCVDSDDYAIPPVPSTGFFKETFNKVTKAEGEAIVTSPWPKISMVSNFDGEVEGVLYSDKFGMIDVRRLNGTSDIAKKELFLWFPSGRESSLTIDNINLGKRRKLVLRYNFNANIYNSDEKSNTNKLKVKFNGVDLPVPDIELNAFNNRNKYQGVLIRIPDEILKEISNMEFISNAETNDRGFRIDDIELLDDYPY